MSLVLVLNMYYLVHHFQIFLWVGVAPLRLSAHITKAQFLVMWVIDDLEWREYLAYNIVCYYIQYHQLEGYGILEFKVGCLGFSALHHYYNLEIAYQNDFHHHQISTSSRPTFIMIHMVPIPDHVISWANIDLE